MTPKQQADNIRKALAAAAKENPEPAYRASVLCGIAPITWVGILNGTHSPTLLSLLKMCSYLGLRLVIEDDKD